MASSLKSFGGISYLVQYGKDEMLAHVILNPLVVTCLLPISSYGPVCNFKSEDNYTVLFIMTAPFNPNSTMVK